MLLILLVAGLCLLVGVAIGLGLQTVTISSTISGYVNSQQSVAVSDSSGLTANPTIPVAQPGTLTARTNNTSGTITMNTANHGITNAQRVDLYWNGGQAYGAVVGTVSGNSVPIASIAGGTALVANNSAITVGIPQSTDFSFTGNNLTALVYVAQQAGWFVLSDGTNNLNPQYVNGGQSYNWYTNSGVTNPLASTLPTVAWMSSSFQTAAVLGNQTAALTH